MAKMQKRPSQTEEYFQDKEKYFQDKEKFSTNFDCQICMNTVSEEKRFRNHKRCSHSLCKDCISHYITVTVETTKMAHIRCPDLYCDNLLDPISCSPILPVTVFEKWSDLLCELEVFRSPWAYCPSRDCSELILDECGGNARKSSCPKCNTLFCFQCNNPWHRGYRCSETRRISNSHDILLTQLAETNKWTKCPGCNCFVERIDGCSIIQCRCGTHFCHDCGKRRPWRWCRCKYQKIDRSERVSMYIVTLLLMVLCYVVLIWSVRSEVLYNTSP